MNELRLDGMTTVAGVEVPKIEGGFGESKKSMLAKDIAGFHCKKLKHVNEAINNNRDRFRVKVDLIDLKKTDFAEELIEDDILSTRQVAMSKNIYLLSERGYAKLIKIFNDDLSWELYDKLLDEYFDMREQLSDDRGSYQIQDPVARAEKWIEEEKQRQLLLEENQKKDQVIGELQPKADYVDEILNSKGLVTITQIAKDYGMSGKKMNALLNDLGVQYKQSGQWLLYSKYHDKGYTKSKTFKYKDKYGVSKTKLHTKWCQKGRIFLYNLLKEEGVFPTIEKTESENNREQLILVK